MMRWVGLYISLLLAIAAPLLAYSNLHITEIGLHGYFGTPTPIQLVVRNPLPQPQQVHLRIRASNKFGNTSVVTNDVTLSANEERRLELPALLQAGDVTVMADATAEGVVIAQ